MPLLSRPVADLEAFRQAKLFELPDFAFDGRLRNPKAFCDISSSLAVAFPDQLKRRCGPGSCLAALISRAARRFRNAASSSRPISVYRLEAAALDCRVGYHLAVLAQLFHCLNQRVMNVGHVRI